MHHHGLWIAGGIILVLCIIGYIAHPIFLYISLRKNTHSNRRTLMGASTRENTTDTEIHPAPSEFSNAQIAADPILHFFHYSHLPPKLQTTSRQFMILAHTLITSLPRNPERTVALRKLLEAKDAAVRANLPAPGMQPARGLQKEPELNEPVEILRADEDRDGPIPFDG